MSTASEPTSLTDEMDDAFFNFMIEEGFYIREGTGVITNPKYPYSLSYATDRWLAQKKEQFGTLTNNPKQWTLTSKSKKSSSR